MERKALMWTCLLKHQTKSRRIPKYPHCKEALNANACSNISQLITIVWPLAKVKKTRIICFIFSNKWHHVEITNKHCPAYKLQSTSRGRDPAYTNPLNGKNVSRKGSRWGLSSEAVSLVNHLSLRLQLVFVSVGRCGSCPVCTWIGITRHPFALLVTVTWGISVTLGCRTWIYSRECWHGLASSPSKQTLCD